MSPGVAETAASGKGGSRATGAAEAVANAIGGSVGSVVLARA